MRATVAVPATCANLGPGFDSFGLALDLCNEVTVDTGSTPGVTWEGEGADELPSDGADLVSMTMASVAREMGLELPTFGLHGLNRIPLERGLGSSSAAAVAGVVLASVLLDLGMHEDPYSIFSKAAGIEGHPDNAAPAVFGGFTIALPGGFVRRLEPHAGLSPVILVPDVRLSTSAARAALSARVSREDAVFNSSHAALMVEALTRDPSLLPTALDDRLHEAARLELVPEAQYAFEDLRKSHVPVCVSGAGPSLLAFELEGRAPLEVPGPGWLALRPGVRSPGFVLES